ncbi:MAG: PilW family protein [Gallionellaceae bacterium]|jgi:type IV pilus assembly protein PilW
MNAYTPIRTPYPKHFRAEMSGFSMVEMMISITIGLMIVAALVGVLTSSSGSTKTNDRTAELQSNGRYALDHLKRELRQAGYRGYTPKAPESGSWTTPTITGECGTAGRFVKNIRQAVWGKNDSNPFAASCIPSASYLQGDVLVIRRADDTPTLAATAAASTLYLSSSYANLNVLQGSALPTAVVTGTEHFELHEYVYYISPFTNSATENPLVPALYRVALQSNGTMTRELVVSGIEHMQFEYGMTNTDGTTQYFTAANIGATTDHSATGATNWDKISSVRIWLLARNAKAETGYNNTQIYQLSAFPYQVDDNFRRQVFTTVVQLRNFRN